MKLILAGILSLALMSAYCSSVSAQATEKPLKIGVLGDESGPFADSGGVGTVYAAELAVRDFDGTVAGRKIEIVHADHQNKPDVGSAIARKWFDTEGVDVILNLTSTPVALAVQEIARERHRITLITGSSSSELTGKACSPYSTQWLEDTYTLSAGIVNGVFNPERREWFFIAVDNGFGEAMVKDASRRLQQLGGVSVGIVRHPLNSADLSSFLLQASSSHADVIALANVGADTANAIKQAHEFGIPAPGKALTAFFFFLSDIHAMGLSTAQNLLVANGFYWDENDKTRAFSKRFEEHMNKKPSDAHGISYAAVSHYLKAAKAAGTIDPDQVAETMRNLPIDFFGRPGSVRSDGRATYDVGLYRVKEPSESKYEYDYLKLVRLISTDEAFRPLKESQCPAVIAERR
jgi:branched-chain amino acid transport system substrate-binding protein